MGIETILYCFIADEEMFSVSERFAGPELVNTIASAQVEHKFWKSKKESKSKSCCCGGGGGAGGGAGDGPEPATPAAAAGSVSAAVVSTGTAPASSV